MDENKQKENSNVFELLCRYYDHGCDYFCTQEADLQDHEKNCIFQMAWCVGDENCGKYMIKDMAEHVKKFHPGAETSEGPSNSKTLTRITELVVMNERFYTCMMIKGAPESIWYFWVYFEGRQDRSDKFNAKITISKTDSPCQLMYICPVVHISIKRSVVENNTGRALVLANVQMAMGSEEEEWQQFYAKLKVRYDIIPTMNEIFTQTGIYNSTEGTTEQNSFHNGPSASNPGAPIVTMPTTPGSVQGSENVQTAPGTSTVPSSHTGIFQRHRGNPEPFPGQTSFPTGPSQDPIPLPGPSNVNVASSNTGNAERRVENLRKIYEQASPSTRVPPQGPTTMRGPDSGHCIPCLSDEYLSIPQSARTAQWLDQEPASVGEVPKKYKYYNSTEEISILPIQGSAQGSDIHNHHSCNQFAKPLNNIQFQQSNPVNDRIGVQHAHGWNSNGITQGEGSSEELSTLPNLPAHEIHHQNGLQPTLAPCSNCFQQGWNPNGFQATHGFQPTGWNSNGIPSVEGSSEELSTLPNHPAQEFNPNGVQLGQGICPHCYRPFQGSKPNAGMPAQKPVGDSNFPTVHGPQPGRRALPNPPFDTSKSHHH